MTDEKKIDALIEEAMSQVQVFASAWSMVGGPFDDGDCLENAEVEKHATRALFRDLINAAIEQAARATAEQSRDSVIEECALIVEQHQETFTTMSGGEEERHLTTRRHGNQMGMAYANAIRALKSQQDAAIESKPAEQSQPVAWISVDERLPKACTEVLVWRIDSGPFIAQLVAPCDVPDADDESDDLRWLADAYGWQEGSEKPTYWKPLPEGPIVESQRSGDGS